jgi:AraC-like DNA-binding protein/uncharacterized protein YjlB
VKAGSYSWEGFEFVPRGYLLEQLVDLDGELGVAYERGLQFYKAPHVHDRLMLVAPRGACAMQVGVGDGGRPWSIDSAQLMVVPAGVRHDDRGTGTIYDTLALYPSAELVEQLLGAPDAPPGWRSILSRCARIARTPWISALLEELFHEAVVLRRAGPRRRLLGLQLLTELLHTLEGSRATPGERAGDSGVADRALRYIEMHLYEPLSLPQLARAAGASVASLLRHFKQATGTTPGSYVRRRRLEDAARLLRSGEHRVSEVAHLVGYRSLSAFSAAFTATHGRPPSELASMRAGPGDG